MHWDIRGLTLREILNHFPSQYEALEWLVGELRSGRVKRYWRGEGEVIAVYRINNAH